MCKVVNNGGETVANWFKFLRDFERSQVLLEEDDAPMQRPEAMIVVRNALDRERQLEKQQKHLEEVREALGKKGRNKGGHGKSVYAMVDHPSLKRNVTESEKRPVQYVLNTGAIRREEQLAGTRMLRTTLTEMEASELFDGYQLLQEFERNHREYKGPLALRPAYHRSAERIRANVILTVIAGNCVRRLEALTGCLMADLRKRFEASRPTESGRTVASAGSRTSSQMRTERFSSGSESRPCRTTGCNGENWQFQRDPLNCWLPDRWRAKSVEGPYNRMTKRIQAHVIVNILVLSYIRMRETRTGKRLRIFERAPSRLKPSRHRKEVLRFGSPLRYPGTT